MHDLADLALPSGEAIWWGFIVTEPKGNEKGSLGSPHVIRWLHQHVHSYSPIASTSNPIVRLPLVLVLYSEAFEQG